MVINEIACYTKYQLIDKIFKVTMLKDPDCFPYKSAYITIEKLDPLCLSPCQFYVLKHELASKIELQETFETVGVDIFDMQGYTEFKAGNDPSVRTLLPPIIEESVEQNGKIYHLINDGMHRTYLALLQKRKINVICVRGSSKPYYAYPLINGWADVKVVSELTKDVIKKVHRISNNKKLYRNFDSVFTNCSKPRGLSNEVKNIW